MAFFSRFLPKRKPPEIKNNIPKEKENIKKTFAVYCGKEHGSKDGRLCPKCTALLAMVMRKMDRCPYGITKPICDRCDISCFGESQTREFRAIMSGSQKSMFLSHPIMTLKHKLASMGVDYAKYQQQKKADDKAKAKEKAASERAKKKKTKKKGKEQEKKED